MVTQNALSCPFYLEAVMTEERRLIMLGIPAVDAISLCHSMRRDGTLPEFIREQERKRGRGERVCGNKFESSAQACR